MITLITVVRNSSKLIEATLKSVISQKTRDLEYIVIDGASTDGTIDIIKKYHENIDKFVSEPDRGIYNAINKGIAIASGSLIGIVHSGDVLLPNVIERIEIERKLYPDTILYGCVKAMDGQDFKGIWGWSHTTLSEKMLPHMACFVPRNVYSNYGCYDESFRIAGDYEAFLRYYTNKVSFKFIDIIVQEFDINGVSQRLSSEKEVEMIQKKYGVFIEVPRYARLLTYLKERVKRLLSLPMKNYQNMKR